MVNLNAKRIKQRRNLAKKKSKRKSVVVPRCKKNPEVSDDLIYQFFIFGFWICKIEKQERLLCKI